jgi:magnesium chelatase family protein
MLCSLESAALIGLESVPVQIEVDVASGLPGFGLVGLPDTAVREARERIFSALKNSGFEVPSRRITVNLAPGDLRKEGTAFDLPMALGILIASEQIPAFNLPPLLFAGELALDGSLRPVRGVLNLALGARNHHKGIFIPSINAPEASRVKGLDIFHARDLRQTIERLAETPLLPPIRVIPEIALLEKEVTGIDLAEIRGQVDAKRALEIATGGGHHLLAMGSPGCGKSLLARSLPRLLPTLSESESLETTRIYSAAGLLGAGRREWISTPPFRSPHAGISPQALVGGGRNPRPGEISLAHNGVLFLDELPEFPRMALEAMRQPLEEGAVWVSRLHASCRFPSRFMLMAAMNPCPCGFLGDPLRACRCDGNALSRYRSRLSGPLLDRFDLHIEVAPVPASELFSQKPVEASAEVAQRVWAMRERQRHRYREDGIHCNGQMGGALIERHCRLSATLRTYLEESADYFRLSARSCHKVLKLARSLADAEGREEINEGDLAEAFHFRVGETVHNFSNT